jgi:prepilin-type N-terminal cleavage/methylation domain-containing protein
MERKYPSLRRIRPPAPSRRRVGGQAGYTLIEMVLVVAILGLLAVAVNQAIVHTVRIGSRGTDSMTAIAQLENASYWLNIDGQQAQEMQSGKVNGFPLELTWTAWNGNNHKVTYSIQDDEMTRSTYINDVFDSQMTIARYLDPDAAKTNCRLPSKGTFRLPDTGDAITITGWHQSSSGSVAINSGAVSVNVTGTASYNDGDWSTPAVGDQVILTASAVTTAGTWAFTDTGAIVGLTGDEDGDATVTGNAIIVTLTAFGGENSSISETREYMLFPFLYQEGK